MSLYDKSDVLVFFCNGKKIVDHHAQPEVTILTYLRTKLLLTGSKLGCGEGGCGACTIMVSQYSTQSGSISHHAVNACLIPICSLHGMAVTTIEGIGSIRTRLHPVQERLAKAHGTQCGFCTPGIVMSMYALLRNRPQPTMDEIQTALAGNLCRCTGYRSILQGYSTFTKEGCCGGSRDGKCCLDKGAEGVSTELFDPSEFQPYHPSQEVIFPPELKIMLDKEVSIMKTFKGDQVTWFRPITLQEVLALKEIHPNASMVVGNTEVGIEVKFKNRTYPVLIDLNHVPELTSMETTPNGVRIGASVPLTTLDGYLKQLVKTQPEHKTRIFAAVVDKIQRFGSTQIRNKASLGGTIARRSPISDLNPVLMAADCTLEVTSKRGTRLITMDANVFTGSKQDIIAKDEVIQVINIPFTSENEYMKVFKLSLRREMDISVVNAAMRVVFKPGTNVVEECRLAFGGMAATSVFAVRTMASLKGRAWCDGLVEAMCPLLIQDLPLPPGAPGGMEPYRQSLTLGFFFKFYLFVLEKITKKLPDVSGSTVPTSYKTANQDHRNGFVKAVQMFQEVPSTQPDSDGVGRPLTHLDALKQVTGEAVYVDDIPAVKGELYLGLVMSEKAHAKIVAVDASAALTVEGVHSFVDIDDVPGSNLVGAVIQDDLLFADKEVTCVGQVIGVVVADNQAIAQSAAKLVKVDYEELPATITIEDAIEQNSFYPTTSRPITRGNIQAGMESSHHTLEGEIHIGGQEHFYLETFSTLILPGEDGEVEVISATQSPTTAQTMVSKALGVPGNKVKCRVKRVGGGFGGKDMRCCVHAAMCAVAAVKINRPVRLMLDRVEDMSITGIREPVTARYKVGYNDDGQLNALQIDLYANCGNSLDASGVVLTRALFHCENAYNIPSLSVTGHLCKTNLPSCTAFRGFGLPQSLLIIESVISDVASKCGLSQTKVREINFFREGDETCFGQELKNWNLKRCWNKCLTQSDFEERRRDVTKFNGENRWRKRGIAVTPMQYGAAFEYKTLNQAGALVHIYNDGSVLLSHGGVEMGQGLHTKMIQVASKTLGIPQEKIHISETSTQTVPNTTPTAGSISSDINGMAIKAACETLLQRLDQFVQDEPRGSWESWVMSAYLNRVSLSATGFYKIPDLHFNWDTNRGTLYRYFVFGVAVTEVEIDCLTGSHQVLRTDIVMDVGDSINPAIDIGQIEGGFIQGYGYYVLEDYRIAPSGHLLTKGPGLYKIPAIGDIPKEFNVSLLTRTPNPFAICSSKAVGEPPLMLAASVFFAIKDAIQSAREDAGITGVFRLDSPTTAERIRMACQDQFTQRILTPEPGTYVPFFIRP
ncbi:xanthine dehydrogenase/oxidase-like [Asterias amurensis]|uniref:xanthine dehydrogenase/oxidase-like n=1 Tax=Asterias amurensis TaxID=7602 RepID=UPI003AB42671